MSNPRQRDRIDQSAVTTPRAKLTSIPSVRTTEELIPFAVAVKEALDVRSGARSPWEKWWTGRDLSDLGLLPGVAQSSVPTDAASIPVMTTRGTYVHVTLAALAHALDAAQAAAATATTQTGTSSITRDEFLALSRQVSALAGGIDRVALDDALAKSQSLMRQEWAQADSDVLTRLRTALRSQIDELHSIVIQQAAQTQRLLTGYTHVQTTSDTTWVVEHYLNRFPIVQILDATNTPISPSYAYTDENTVTVTHGAATTGTVICR